MAEHTKIAWADATVNFWWGCTDVSEGCDHCYARTLAKRRGVAWGPHAPRRKIAGAVPLLQKLQRQAEHEGRRIRAFSNSMADFFDAKVRKAWRAEAWAAIRYAWAVDLLILTKRPKSIPSMLPDDWGVQQPGLATTASGWSQVWLGTSVESGDYVHRLDELRRVPAALYFASLEPLLAPVDIMAHLAPPMSVTWGPPDMPPRLRQRPTLKDVQAVNQLGRAALRHVAGVRYLDWVIVGGESGAGHRTLDLDALASVVDQCRSAGVPVFVKQDSGPYPDRQGRIPDDLWIREWPASPGAMAFDG